MFTTLHGSLKKMITKTVIIGVEGRRVKLGDSKDGRKDRLGDSLVGYNVLVINFLFITIYDLTILAAEKCF